MSNLISFDGYFALQLVFRVMNINLFLHRGVRLLSGIAHCLPCRYIHCNTLCTFGIYYYGNNI